MVRYYAQHNDSGKLIAIGTGYGGTEITEAEYNTLLAEIRAKAQLVDDVYNGVKTLLMMCLPNGGMKSSGG